MSRGIVDLDIDDVKDGLASGALTLVDVREPHEYAAGHIPARSRIRSRPSIPRSCASIAAASCSPARLACAR